MKKATSKTKSGTAMAKADSALLARARKVVEHYRLLIEPRPDGGFSGSAVELPLTLGRGETEIDCIRDTRAALVRTVVSYLQDGNDPPAPASDHRREVQMNIRLTADERLRIEERARVAGYRSVSDYMRRAALRGVG